MRSREPWAANYRETYSRASEGETRRGVLSLRGGKVGTLRGAEPSQSLIDRPFRGGYVLFYSRWGRRRGQTPPYLRINAPDVVPCGIIIALIFGMPLLAQQPHNNF